MAKIKFFGGVADGTVKDFDPRETSDPRHGRPRAGMVTVTHKSGQSSTYVVKRVSDVPELYTATAVSVPGRKA